MGPVLQTSLRSCLKCSESKIYLCEQDGKNLDQPGPFLPGSVTSRLLPEKSAGRWQIAAREKKPSMGHLPLGSSPSSGLCLVLLLLLELEAEDIHRQHNCGKQTHSGGRLYFNETGEDNLTLLDFGEDGWIGGGESSASTEGDGSAG